MRLYEFMKRKQQREHNNYYNISSMILPSTDKLYKESNHFIKKHKR